MNPHIWTYSDRGLHTHPDPNPPQRDVENVFMKSMDQETHSRFTAIQPHSSKPVWRETSPPSHERREDFELARKKKELQELNDRILFKKASIAVKTIKHVVNTPTSASCEERLDFDKGQTLRDRVTQILQQRQSSLFSKLQSSNERLKSSILSKERLQQEHHPLKLRVQTLRKHRHRAPSVLLSNRDKVPDVPPLPSNQRINSPAKEENRGFDCFVKMLNKGADINLIEMASDVPAPPSSRSITTPAKEENVSSKEPGANINKVPDVPPPPLSQNAASPARKIAAEKGFERFLSMLNKGVDINLLSRIVKDDKEDLTNTHATGVKAKWNQAPRSESQRSSSGSSQPGCSKIGSAESKTNSLQQERSLPDAKEAKHTKRGNSLDSSSQSESSQTVKKKKKKEGEESPKLDEKQEQLQSILKTLGLNLEVDELNKLNDRTQERLYGKKSKENQTMDSRTEQDEQQMPSHRNDRKSCSSSSSSSSSRFSSKSFSRSPSSCHLRSRSKEKRSCSRERSSDQHQSRDKAQRRRYRDEEEDRLNSTHSVDHRFYQNTQSTGHCNPYRHDDTNPYSRERSNSRDSNPFSSEINPYSRERSNSRDSNPYSSEINPYSRERSESLDSNPFSSETNPSWSYLEQYRSNYVTGVSSKNSFVKRCHNISINCLKDIMLSVNPDLSQSEGQGGTNSASRCLTVVDTKNSQTRRKGKNKREVVLKRIEPRTSLRNNISITDSDHRRPHPNLKVISSHGPGGGGHPEQLTSPEASQSEQKKDLTEEEIRTNLRKKLQVFNQKAKEAKPLQNTMQPADFLNSELS